MAMVVSCFMMDVERTVGRLAIDFSSSIFGETLASEEAS